MFPNVSNVALWHRGNTNLRWSEAQRGSEGRTNSGQITVYYGHCSARAAGLTIIPLSNTLTMQQAPCLTRRRHHHQARPAFISNFTIPFLALISWSSEWVLIANHEVMEQIRVLLSLRLIRIVFHFSCHAWRLKIYILQLVSSESNVVTFDKTN